MMRRTKRTKTTALPECHFIAITEENIRINIKFFLREN